MSDAFSDQIGRSVYGCRETNTLSSSLKKESETIERRLDWTDKTLARIERLRLLSDPGYPTWDVSYCYGRTHDGELVRVQLPFSQLSKRAMQKEIIAHAKRDKVFAKGLGIFDAISTLN